MKSKKRLYLIVGILFTIVAIQFIYFKWNVVRNDETEKELTEIFNQKQETIALDEKLPFDWTEAYIFSPYSSKEFVKETVDRKWISPSSLFVPFLFRYEFNQMIHDSTKRIIFVNGEKVIKDIIYDNQEFDILDDHIEKTDKLVLQEGNHYKKSEKD